MPSSQSDSLSGSDLFEVPVIDISPYVLGGADQDKARVAADVDHACRTVGFMQIRGHGVPVDISSGLADAMDDFFGLPLETKSGYRIAGANRGYSPPKSESLSLSLGVESATRMNDFFEAFNIGTEARSFTELELSEEDYGINLWPAVRGFAERVENYYAHGERVARTLTTIFDDALGLTPGFFESITDHSIDVLRMNNYALPEGAVTLDGELKGMGNIPISGWSPCCGRIRSKVCKCSGATDAGTTSGRKTMRCWSTLGISPRA